MSNSRKMIFGRYDYAAFSALFSYASVSVVIPVALVSLARELGFDLESGGFAAGGALELSRSAGILLTMILSGFIAGKYGKRRTLGIAAILVGIGMLICSYAPAYSFVFVAIGIAGLGEGVIEALITPFVNDLHQQEAGRYVNVTHSFWSIGVLCTVIISGILLSSGVSWRFLILACGVITIIPALILLLPQKTGSKYPEHPEPQHWKHISSQIIAIIRCRRFWVFFGAMFVAGGGEYCLTFWSASYIQLTFTAAAWIGGTGTGVFAAGMIIGRMGGGYLFKQHHLRQLILYAAILGIITTLLFQAVDSLILFFILLLLSGIASAPFWPSIQTYAVDRLPDKDSTMMYILLSCAGIPGCGFFTWLLGYTANISGNLSTPFYIIPGCFIVIFILIFSDYLLNERK